MQELIQCSEFDINDYDTVPAGFFENWYEKMSTIEKYKNMHVIYPKFRNNTYLVFQTPEICMTKFGLPLIKDENEICMTKFSIPLIKDDNSTPLFNFIHIPLDPHQSGCVELKNMLQKIDEYNVNKKNKIFGYSKFEKLFQYNPIIRNHSNPIMEEHYEDSGDEYSEYCEYTAALDFNIDNNGNIIVYEANNIEYYGMKHQNDNKHNKHDCDYVQFNIEPTKFDAYENDFPISPKIIINYNNKYKQNKSFNLQNISDLQQYIVYGSKIKCIVVAENMYAMKPRIHYFRRFYGTSFKIIQMEITLNDTDKEICIEI